LADIIVLPGRGAAPDGQIRSGIDGETIETFAAFEPAVLGGVFVS
jgi:hypothetical protein